MQSDRWRALAPHLDQVLELAPEDRQQWLSDLAARAPSLAVDLRSLLEEHEAVVLRGFLSSGSLPVTVSDVEQAGTGGGVRFAPGMLVASRYRVVRFIARGGMGEVYECWDVELGQALALKTLLPRYAGDATALARFKQELRLARQITHPNVCRLFDVGFHPGQPPLAFITMELLAGETLADRISREGPLPVARARPLLEQMVAGLAAAHAAGVIHLDFKSGNVMLAGERVVITDFGLAVALAAFGPFPPQLAGREAARQDDPDLSGAGGIRGTPAYMAPEQVEGGPLAPATDVHALAVVMFEMVTGSLPFVGDTPLETAYKRLQEVAPAARTRAPGLDRSWDAAISRGLARRPADRFASAPALLAALDRRSRARARWAAGLALLLLGLGVRAAWRPEALTTPRRSVAVVAMKNAAGPELAWLEAALGEMLSAELAAGEKLRTIPGEAVSRMRLELALPAADSYDAETLARIRANLGVDVVVVGSYLTVGKQLRLDLRLQDAATGASLGATSAAGSQEQLFEIVSGAGGELRRKLGAVPSWAAAGRAALPVSPEAARLYSQGLAHSRELDYPKARSVLEQVVRAEPGFAPAHAALADVDLALNDERAGRRESQRALETVAASPREARLLAEARQAWAVRDYARAARIYLSLYTFFPDELQYGRMLARSQLRADQRQEALRTVEAIQRQPGLAQTDPMLDVIEARVAAKLGDRRRWQAAAQRASEKARQQDALFVLADAQMEEGEAWQNLGEPGRAAQAYQTARELYQRFGNRAGLAGALVQVAKLGAEAGKLALARDLYGQALATYRDLDDGYHIARTTDLMGDVSFLAGDLGAARQRWQEALPLWDAAGSREGTAWGKSKLGLVLAEEGELDAAGRHFDEALAIHRELRMRPGEADALTNQAMLLGLRGQLGAAEQALSEPLRLWRELGDQTELAHTLSLQANLARDLGQATRARRLYQEALGLAERSGHPAVIARNRLALAGLDLDEGRAEEASSAALAAAEVLHAASAQDDEAAARELAARAALSRGDLTNASALLAEVRGRTTLRLSLRVHGALTAARLGAARGQPARGRAELRALQGQPRLKAMPLLHLEVRLARAQLAGNSVEVARLGREAAARGYVALAQKARRPPF